MTVFRHSPFRVSIVRLFVTAILWFALNPAAAQQAALVEDAFCPVERIDHLAAFAIPAMQDDAVALRWNVPAEPSGSFRHTAQANVFSTDPADGDAVEVVLQGLLGDGHSLDGEFVRAGSDRIDGQGVAATAPNGDFRFAPDTTSAVLCPTDLSRCQAFDAVNVYYHVDEFARHFWEERMGVDITFKAEARVHVGGDGAFADWNTRSLKLGVGDIFMKNSALSDDLIYHEYNHLVMASLGFEAGIGVSEQTRALHEAYADYFMATWTDDPRVGEWVVTCPPRQQCEGPPNSTDLRTLVLDAEAWNWRQGQPSDDLKYGICTRFHEGDLKCKQSWNNFTNPYIWGMIWGAALWDLRTAIGPEIADRIVLETVRFHTSESGFDEALAQIVETGHALFGPNVGDQVRQAFEQRGFNLATDLARQDVPAADAHTLDLELWPNPAVDEIRIRSGSSDRGRQADWVIEDILGRIVLTGRSPGDAGWSVDISDLAPGLYFVRVRVSMRNGSKPFLKSR